MDPEQLSLFGPGPGYTAVVRWSITIHGKTSARHLWAVHCAQLLDKAGDVYAELPDFPQPCMPGVPERRDTTVRELWARAEGVEYEPPVLGQRPSRERSQPLSWR